MACTGCARRRAKLKRLLELANERFNEMRQRVAGAAVPDASEQRAAGEADARNHPRG